MGVESLKIDVRLAQLSEASLLSAVLARAFHHDPFYRWLFPNESEREKRSRRLFTLFLRDLIPQGVVYTTPGLKGASLWVPPEKARNHWVRDSKHTIQVMRVVFSKLPQAFQWWRIVERKSPRYRHWTLFLLGVAPEHQGHRLGLSLLWPILTRCDKERVDIYLNTSNPKNLSFYQRLGFDLVLTDVLTDKLTVFHMIRKPGVIKS